MPANAQRQQRERDGGSKRQQRQQHKQTAAPQTKLRPPRWAGLATSAIAATNCAVPAADPMTPASVGPPWTCFAITCTRGMKAN
jgi:hypothetical protein